MDTPPNAGKRRTVAWAIAAAATTAVTVAIAAWRDVRPAGMAWLGPVVVLAAGALVAAGRAWRLRALLVGVIAGIILGVGSSLQMLVQPVDGLGEIVSLTVAFFLAFGLTLGGFVEFVLYLDRVAHGRAGKRPAGRA